MWKPLVYDCLSSLFQIAFGSSCYADQTANRFCRSCHIFTENRYFVQGMFIHSVSILRKRQRERERERERERQTDRQTDRDRESEREMNDDGDDK